MSEPAEFILSELLKKVPASEIRQLSDESYLVNRYNADGTISPQKSVMVEFIFEPTKMDNETLALQLSDLLMQFSSYLEETAYPFLPCYPFLQDNK